MLVTSKNKCRHPLNDAKNEKLIVLAFSRASNRVYQQTMLPARYPLNHCNARRPNYPYSNQNDNLIHPYRPFLYISPANSPTSLIASDHGELQTDLDNCCSMSSIPGPAIRNHRCSRRCQSSHRPTTVSTSILDLQELRPSF